MCYKSSLIVFCLCALGTAGKINYCGAKMCEHAGLHTFCLYPPGPGVGCKGYIEARLSPDETVRILARLNQRRNAVASGRLRGFPAAGNMIKLQWVDELAREAQLTSDQCWPPETPEEQDICRDLYSITVGQCVASVVGEAPGLRPESMVDIWYMQNMHYKGLVTFYETPPLNSGYYGDFAQLMWAHTTMVGCARSRFMTSWYGRLRSVERLVCNFAPRGPTVAHPLWANAAPASMCPPRTQPDTEMTSLCSYQYNLDESHDVDKTMTLEEHILLNTVHDIEKNESMNYVGSLDEIYLTRMAIATINKQSIATYSVQKRDTNEILEMAHMNNLNNVNDTKHNQDLNKTQEKIEEHVAKDLMLIKQQKVMLIGRPKSYNMDELNDIIISDQKRENDLDMPMQDIMPNDEKDFYAEYEFRETEENVTTSSTIEDLVTYALNETVSMEDLNSEDKTTTANVNTSAKMTSDYIPVVMRISDNASKKTLDNTERTIEEYLSDPETIKELQEELDHMENAASKPSSGKTRRELRDLSNVPLDNFTTEDKTKRSPTPEVGNSFHADEERNNTLDKAPMLNMVLRYMPYLKEYKDSVLNGTGPKTSSLLSLPLILLVTFYIKYRNFSILDLLFLCCTFYFYG